MSANEILSWSFKKMELTNKQHRTTFKLLSHFHIKWQMLKLLIH